MAALRPICSRVGGHSDANSEICESGLHVEQFAADAQPVLYLLWIHDGHCRLSDYRVTRALHKRSSWMRMRATFQRMEPRRGPAGIPR
jgi:hypothetical protein